jgi:hypothetical protein
MLKSIWWQSKYFPENTVGPKGIRLSQTVHDSGYVVLPVYPGLGFVELNQDSRAVLTVKLREFFLSRHTICYDTDRTENTTFNSSFTAASVFVASETCLQSRWPAMSVTSGSTIPAFRRHVTLRSKVVRIYAHRQEGDLISLLLFFKKEIMLEIGFHAGGGWSLNSHGIKDFQFISNLNHVQLQNFKHIKQSEKRDNTFFSIPLISWMTDVTATVQQLTWQLLEIQRKAVQGKSF